MQGAMFAVGLLAVAVAAIPLLFVIGRVLKIPLRNWFPVLFFLAFILSLHGVAALGGDEILAGLIYWLAGGRGQ